MPASRSPPVLKEKVSSPSSGSESGMREIPSERGPVTMTPVARNFPDPVFTFAGFLGKGTASIVLATPTLRLGEPRLQPYEKVSSKRVRIFVIFNTPHRCYLIFVH
ncbi:hypothetical protein AVEN_157969-1 [Araneus ventricosus]|uniref:Uncharacterized protein n=1 Tax=Araneus ventricosus TaxID=182803 RepID=A0A4Y2NAS3_ARAVE|nr:hypothetical protein AVEN_157969-1 [Araneus ventricosus]